MLAIGIGIGFCVGTVIGIINHNVTNWMLMGVAVGFATGILMEFTKSEDEA